MKFNSLKFFYLLGFFIFSYKQQQKNSKPTVPNENEIKNDDNINNKKNKQDSAGYLSEFSKEWEKKMSDYESDYLYVIPLNKNTEEIYYEDIEMVPARVRGAFFIEEEGNKIDVYIRSEDNKIVFSALAVSQRVFDFKIFVKGKYTISFINKYSSNQIKVTFTMSTGQNAVLMRKDLSQTERKLDQLLHDIKRFNIEFKFNRNLHEKRFNSKNILYNLKK
jgi:hypothetical protein